MWMGLPRRRAPPPSEFWFTDEEQRRIEAAAGVQGRPPFISDPAYTRACQTFWAGDSAKSTTDLQTVTTWNPLTVSMDSGCGLEDWARDLMNFITANEGCFEKVEVEDVQSLATSGLRSTSVLPSHSTGSLLRP